MSLWHGVGTRAEWGSVLGNRRHAEGAMEFTPAQRPGSVFTCRITAADVGRFSLPDDVHPIRLVRHGHGAVGAERDAAGLATHGEVADHAP